MFAPFSYDSPPIKAIVDVPLCDRWLIYYRLQELSIPCGCSAEGDLWVEIADEVTTVQVRSVLQHFLAPLQASVDWLEKCWQLQV